MQTCFEIGNDKLYIHIKKSAMISWQKIGNEIGNDKLYIHIKK